VYEQNAEIKLSAKELKF